MPSGPNRTKTGTSPWAGGDTIEIRNLERFKLPGLTKATVRRIRILIGKKHPDAEVARRVGCHATTVMRIRLGKIR